MRLKDNEFQEFLETNHELCVCMCVFTYLEVLVNKDEWWSFPVEC
jgi:hypothetical protein